MMSTQGLRPQFNTSGSTGQGHCYPNQITVTSSPVRETRQTPLQPQLPALSGHSLVYPKGEDDCIHCSREETVCLHKH